MIKWIKRLFRSKPKESCILCHFCRKYYWGIDGKPSRWNICNGSECEGLARRRLYKLNKIKANKRARE